jgi:hypothetical protein
MSSTAPAPSKPKGTLFSIGSFNIGPTEVAIAVGFLVQAFGGVITAFISAHPSVAAYLTLLVATVAKVMPSSVGK